jgi:type IV pilus assembly protein PilM
MGMMNLGLFGKRRAVGLDVGGGSVRALAMERRRGQLVVTGGGTASIENQLDPRDVAHGIHAVLAAAGAGHDPIVAAVGGPEVVIRLVNLPPLPPGKLLSAIAIQHRELGLHPPGEAVLDGQVLRHSRDGEGVEVLSVSVPKPLVEERKRLFYQAAIDVEVLDVEPLALLNAALYLTALRDEELLVLLNVGWHTTVLCLFSERGPVVARYLETGAEQFVEAARAASGMLAPILPFSSRIVELMDSPRAAAACRELVERLAEDVRLSITFYRTEYDRESRPRFAVSGWVELSHIGRWLADRLGLAALEVLDPLRALEVEMPQQPAGELLGGGPQFLQAFGLALRAL